MTKALVGLIAIIAVIAVGVVLIDDVANGVIEELM